MLAGSRHGARERPGSSRNSGEPRASRSGRGLHWHTERAPTPAMASEYAEGVPPQSPGLAKPTLGTEPPPPTGTLKGFHRSLCDPLGSDAPWLS